MLDNHPRIQHFTYPRSSLRLLGTVPDQVSVLCGRADGSAGKADGAASEAAFRCPSGLARHASTQRRGNVFVADTGNHCIRALVMAADMKSGV